LFLFVLFLKLRLGRPRALSSANLGLRSSQWRGLACVIPLAPRGRRGRVEVKMEG
jgi:hypothetical protein